MNHRITSLLTATLLMVTLSTCKKDDPDCETCQFEQGFQQVKDWMYFKTGSYWIYEEENSGAVDTLTVWDDWQGIAQGENDAFYTHTISSYDGYYYRYRYNSSFSVYCLNSPSCQCEKIDRSKSRPGDFVGAEMNLFFSANSCKFLIPGRWNIYNYFCSRRVYSFWRKSIRHCCF